jgi:hypothetical protein
MPLDTSGYDEFELELGPRDVETPQGLEIGSTRAPSRLPRASRVVPYGALLAYVTSSTADTGKWFSLSASARGRDARTSS